MRIVQSSVFQATPQQVFSLVSKISTLKFIAKPLLYFPFITQPESDEWQPNLRYHMKLRVFGVLPFGKHQISFEKFEPTIIISNESGSMISIWKHYITIHAINDSQVLYSDIVEIKAGVLTPIIWTFARLFYRHRQRRWIKLLQKTQITE